MLPKVEFIAASNHPLANSSHLTPDRTFSTVSLNIARTTDPNEVVNAIRVTPRLRDADLYLFQEVRNEEGRPSVAEEAARKLGHSIAFAASAAGVYDQGLAMVSRHPVTNVQITPLKAYDLRFHCRNRIAMAATVQSPGATCAHGTCISTPASTRKNASSNCNRLSMMLQATLGRD